MFVVIPSPVGGAKGGSRRRSFTYLSIERKKYTFFTPCVKYVFDFHRPPPPSFSGFFAFFVTVGWRSVEVICKPFPKSENFSPVYGCRPTADQIITACRPLMGVWIEIDWVLAQCPLVAGRPCVRGVD